MLPDIARLREEFLLIFFHPRVLIIIAFSPLCLFFPFSSHRCNFQHGCQAKTSNQGQESLLSPLCFACNLPAPASSWRKDSCFLFNNQAMYLFPTPNPIHPWLDWFSLIAWQLKLWVTWWKDATIKMWRIKFFPWIFQKWWTDISRVSNFAHFKKETFDVGQLAVRLIEHPNHLMLRPAWMMRGMQQKWGLAGSKLASQECDKACLPLSTFPLSRHATCCNYRRLHTKTVISFILALWRSKH